MNVPKLLINKPVMHILIGNIIGICMYCFLKESLMSAVIIAALFIFFIYKVYDIEYFKIIILFSIIGFITMVAYFNLIGNKYGIYKIRVNEVYESYSIGTLQGRRVYIYSKDELKKNQKVKLKGKYKKEEFIEKGIVGNVFIKEVIKVEEDLLYKLREIPKQYNDYLNKYFEDEDSAILTALIFGDKSYLNDEDKTTFKELGIIHLICISGFHIALIYGLMKKFLKEKVSLGLTLIYVIITGTNPSAVRAFVMLLMLYIGKCVFKNYDAKNSLGLSALILLIVNPTNLFNIGFHLTYLATLGIILLYKFLNKGFYRLPKYIREGISLSLSAQLFIYPYMIVVFKSFSMNFLLGSILLTPIITILVPMGLLLLLCSFLAINLNSFAYLINIIFYIYNGVINILKNLAVPIVYSSNIFFVAYMLIIICFYMYYKCGNGYKFKELSYFFIIGLVLCNFKFGTTISLFKSSWNKALVVEAGFSKDAYTNSDNNYFKEEIKKHYALLNIEDIEGNKILKIDEDLYLFINSNIDKSFLMLKKNKYDIIDLLNNEKRIYHKGKFIYIDERGTKK